LQEESIYTGIHSNDNGSSSIQRIVIYYIECSIGTAEEITASKTATAIAKPSLFDEISDSNQLPPPTAPIEPVVISAMAVSSEVPTFAQRLQNLESIKDHITDEEYNKKRQDILGEV